MDNNNSKNDISDNLKNKKVCTNPSTWNELLSQVSSSSSSFSSSVLSTLKMYASLSKLRLSSLVILTTAFGYYMAPSTKEIVFDLKKLTATTIGTALAVFSANTLNQCIEVNSDAKMNRTANRVLPSGRMSRFHAITFGISVGLAGCTILSTTVNPTCSKLAASNIILYTLVYTPLKQVHPVNTWIGSVVGAIPPMIGWCGKTSCIDPGAWILGSVLFIWQIPHFLALSWYLRNDYKNGGYKMLSNTSPKGVPLMTLFWTSLLLPLGYISSLSNVTDSIFTYDSLIPSVSLLYLALNFLRENTETKSRKLFKGTLYFLPVYMGLMLFHKNQQNLFDQDFRTWDPILTKLQITK